MGKVLPERNGRGGGSGRSGVGRRDSDDAPKPDSLLPTPYAPIPIPTPLPLLHRLHVLDRPFAAGRAAGRARERRGCTLARDARDEGTADFVALDERLAHRR